MALPHACTLKPHKGSETSSSQVKIKYYYFNFIPDSKLKCPQRKPLAWIQQKDFIEILREKSSIIPIYTFINGLYRCLGLFEPSSSFLRILSQPQADAL
jgi:hypothetical protein